MIFCTKIEHMAGVFAGRTEEGLQEEEGSAMLLNFLTYVYV